MPTNSEVSIENVDALGCAAVLLAAVLAADSAVPLASLARRACVSERAAAHLLTVLERHGLVQARPSGGHFRPGPVVLRFAAADPARPHLATVAR